MKNSALLTLLFPILLFISSCSTSNLSVGTVRVKHNIRQEENTPEAIALTDTGRNAMQMLPVLSTDLFFPSTQQTTLPKELAYSGSFHHLFKPAKPSTNTNSAINLHHKKHKEKKEKVYTGDKYKRMADWSFLFSALELVMFVFSIITVFAALPEIAFLAFGCFMLGMTFSALAFMLGTVALSHHKRLGLVGVIVGGVVIAALLVSILYFMLTPPDGHTAYTGAN